MQKLSFLILCATMTFSWTSMAIQPPSQVNAQKKSNNAITMSWNKPTGAVKYNVYLNNKYKTTTSATSYIFKNLRSGTHRMYVVAIDKKTKFSAKSKVRSVTLNNSTPPPPSKPKKPTTGGSNKYGVVTSYQRPSDSQRSRSPLGLKQNLRNNRFKTKTTRISSGRLHHYSKRQTFNANENLINLRGQIINARTFQLVSSYQSGISDVERNWSNINPQLIYGVGSDKRSFVSFNLQNKKLTRILNLSAYNDCTMGAHEGNISNDDTYVFLSCKKGSTKYGISIDLKRKKVLGTILLDQQYYNWGGFSQSGRYIIIQGFGGNNVAHLYDKNLRKIRNFSSFLNHGDFGYDDKGKEIFASISWDYVSYIRLDDGQVVHAAGGIKESKMTSHGHLSCRNTKRRGWCYISSNAGPVAAIKMSKGNNTRTVEGSRGRGILGVDKAEFMGFHRSTQKNYNAEAKASVSPSGTKVLVNSDWFGRATTSTYMIEYLQ